MSRIRLQWPSCGSLCLFLAAASGAHDDEVPPASDGKVPNQRRTSTDDGHLYNCPDAPPPPARNDDVPDYFDYHQNNSISSHLQGEKEQGVYGYYTLGFRNSLHGGHHMDYTEYKGVAREFRAHIFGNELKDGDIIYEGAGAEGMNLLMTLEILHEERGINNLVAYGHDYLSEMVDVANKLWHVQSQANGAWLKFGRYCQGDSTNLHFVPSDVFDLAYTYIDVLIDGQGIFEDDVNDDERCERMKDLCESGDPLDIAIVEKDQLMQEEWHAEWVTEMIRIVKPGKMVVIENVCLPLCLGETPWGGVDLNWWSQAAKQYEWDIDIESIQLYQSWFGDAYTATLRKKGGDSEQEELEADAEVAQDSEPSNLHELHDGNVLASAMKNDGNEEDEEQSDDASEVEGEEKYEGNYVNPERFFSKLTMKKRTHSDSEL